MNISQLIEKLQQYPQYLEIKTVSNFMGGNCELYVCDESMDMQEYICSLGMVKNKDYESYPKLPNLNGLDYP